MRIIISHSNTDFDALASMIAAQKLYPDADVIMSSEQSTSVKQFLSIYRDTFNLVQDNLVKWDEVTDIILVDVTSTERIGGHAKNKCPEDANITVFDHHPDSIDEVNADTVYIEPVGAAVTILIEKIIENNIRITPFEATLFALGIYADTGSFKYPNTTIRDFKAVQYLMENNMSLEVIQRFTDYKISELQKDLLNCLMQNYKTFTFDGLKVVIASHQMKTFQNGLATLTSMLLENTGADAAISVVEMKKNTYIVGRAHAERITLQPLLERFHGGGHDQAGSAIVKDHEFSEVFEEVTNHLNSILKPAITAEDMMTSPVKTLPPDTTIEEAGRLMYRYGHSGFPVVSEDGLMGLVTRRDLDKANHHKLGHAPVKAYMTKKLLTVEPENTVEEMQNIIIKNNIGRLPVMKNGNLVGIVTRTNVIEMLHDKNLTEALRNQTLVHLEDEMEKQFSDEILSVLKEISHTAEKTKIPAYLVGGIVRDLFLKRPNDDIDIVVEGNGILFLETLQQLFGGSIRTHEQFGTGTWKHSSGQMIDITSARLEYYSEPASLPDVETSTLKEDLYRRDFTINSMALSLNHKNFGSLVDPFNGQDDLRNAQIKVLHNLSFVDDPTRILRAVRFEERFDFLMDSQTEDLVLHSIGRIKDLSKDRLIQQLKRLFNEGESSGIINRLFELNFWKQLSVNDSAKKESLNQTKNLCSLYESYEGFQSSWFNYFTIPFYNSDVLYIAQQYGMNKPNKKFIKDIYHLTNKVKWKHIDTIGEFHRVLKDISEDAVLFILAAEPLEQNSVLIEYLKRRQDMQMLLTGEDLIKAGLKPGPEFRKIILDSDVAVLNGEIKTKKEADNWLKQYI